MFIFEREGEREREREQGRGRERGRSRIWSTFQALSCQHRAPHGAWTHKPRDHDLSWSHTLNWATQAPHVMTLKLIVSVLYLQLLVITSKWILHTFLYATFPKAFSMKHESYQIVCEKRVKYAWEKCKLYYPLKDSQWKTSILKVLIHPAIRKHLTLHIPEYSTFVIPCNILT